MPPVLLLARAARVTTVNLEGAIDTCTLSCMVDHRVEAPAGFWIVTAAIFAINAVLAARNGMGLMAFFALIAAVAALCATWVALPKHLRSKQH